MKTFSKRLLTMLLAAAMVFSLSGMTAFAAEDDTSDGGITTYDVGEEPTLNDDGFYEIASKANLEWFADQVNSSSNSSINAILTDDIDVSDSESFTTMCTATAYASGYRGTFDGDGHTITLDINNPDDDYQGLFGHTYNATIRNLTVDGSVTGKQYVAGIVGKMEGGSMTRCVNNAAVSGTSSIVGGLVGNFNSISSSVNTGIISECGNNGTVHSDLYNVGGITGYTSTGANFAPEIDSCYNHGVITGQYALGGIVGRCRYTTTIDSCYNTGAITETERTTQGSSYCSGGLVGLLGTSSGGTTVSNSFNRGNVTSGYTGTSTSSYIGALVGGADGSRTVYLDHVYYLEGTAASYYGPSSSGSVDVTDDSVASKTAEEMKEMDFLDLVNANFAFTLGEDYPILKWESEDRSPYMLLREEYEDDLKLESIDWTPETWDVFEATLQAAGELLEDPNATDEQLTDMYNDLVEAKKNLEWIEPDYTVKYAVSIYDINKDVDEDGNTLGLTFGPATARESYTRSYKAHLTEEEYEAGEGICLHWMSWKDIIRQSKEDPEAFRDCLNNGCTHSIELVLNDTLLDPDYTFNRMTGDGCGILYYCLRGTYLQVNYKYGDTDNYGDTTFRRTLNTESYSILSCMPEDLQNGIVARKVQYAHTAGSSTVDVCYDKLWMFGLYELGAGGTSIEGSQYYRPTSTNVNNSSDNRTYKLYNRYETGEYGSWMTPRSLYGSYDKSIYSVYYQGDDQYGTISGTGVGGMSFGFCLAGPEANQELSAFAVYSADDSSLTFYTDYTVPTKGSTYDEKTVTAVYTDVDQTVAAGVSDIPWEDVCTDVTDVVIDSTFADAQPTSLAYWFDGFANAEFSGLNYIDTTDVTSMSYMFHDCTSLTGLDLADWDTTGVAEADGVEFATGCTDLQWVKIGEATNIFRLNQNVDQQFWYDSQANGTLVSIDYLQDVTEAGTYWSGTMETAGYITIKIGDTSSLLFYEDIDEAIAKAEENTFSCDGTPVTAQFVLLSDLIGIDDDFCSYTVAAEGGSVTGGLPPDTYLYKTEDGKYRTAVDGGAESQWVSDPETIEVVKDHVWDVDWTWTGLPLYCTTDNQDFEPLSAMAIQPWSVVQSLNIATLSGNTIDATATAVGTCENCGKTETLDAALTAEYLSDEPDEYVGALAEITATAAFSDGQKATDKVKVLAPATGRIVVNYLRDDETVKTGTVTYASINDLINKTEPFAIHYTASGGKDTYLTMPFVSITDALGMSEDENCCYFTAYGTDGYTGTIPADGYLYQRNKADDNGNAYYYRTAVGTNSVRPTVRTSQTFVSYVYRVDVQYMHKWGTPEWTWSDDHSSATVTVSCTRDNGSGMVLCDYTDEVDATIDVTTQNGYTVYTATATLVDGTVVTDVQRVEIPASTPEAFAVYCADENSLSFYVDEVPAAGDTYDGKEITEVYTGLEGLGLADASEQPWYSYESSITDVEIDSTFAAAQPTSLAYWFDGFANAAFSGLNYMDTTKVTSMSYMFHDCAALASLDLSDWNTTSVTDGEQFATGCTDLEWVKIGEDTNIFTLSQNVDQQYWFDSAEGDNLVSDKYLQDVTEPGQYWTYTKPAVDVTITADGAADDISKTYNGEEITLAAEASVTPADVDTAYQWYYKGDGDTEFTLIGTAAGSTLTLAGDVVDSGTYKCEVTATLGDESTTADSNEITITITAAAQELSYAQTTVEKYDYDADFTNELTTGTVFGEISYASSNTDVATVDSETGLVHIVGTGYAVITATAAGSDEGDYTEASATYTLAVNPDAFAWEIDVNREEVTWDEDKGEYVDDITYTGADMELEMVITLTDEEEAAGASISYQWYRFVPDLGDYEPIDGADEETYTLTGDDVNAGDYIYMCMAVVTYSNGYAHTVYSPIEVIIEKADQKVVFTDETLDKTVGDPSFTNPLTDESVIDTEGGAIITYTSDNTEVATVDATTGEVTIVGAGEATITATVTATDNYNGAEGSYTITAAEPMPTVGDVTITTSVGDTSKNYDGAGFNLSASADVTPEGVSVTYQWYGPDGAAIDGETSSTYTTSGNVAASGTYKCVVTATNSTGSADAEGTIEITIEKADQTIKFTEETVELAVGDIYENPLTADSFVVGDVTYATDNASVATVDEESGEVTIVGLGTAKITATAAETANYNGASDSYTITTNDAGLSVTVSSDLTGNEKTYNGESVTMTAEAASSVIGATFTYQWYKEDDSGSYEPVSDATKDTLTLTGNVSDSGTYRCTVTVSYPNGETGTVNGTIEITITQATQELSYAQTTVSKYDYDADFTNELTKGTVFGEISYASGNTNVATVDSETGLVHIVGTGYTVITATAAGSDEGNYTEASATYTLTVNTDQVKWEIDVNYDQVEWDEDKGEYVDDITYTGADMELEMVINLTAEEEAAGATISYQWYRFVPEISDYEPIDGAVNDTYTLTGEDVNAGDYIYMCMAVVTYSNGYAHTVYSPIEVIIEKADQKVVFTDETLDKTVGDDPFTNPLSDESVIDEAGGAELTYTSSDETVATVDAETGEVTIVAAGEATITATVTGTDNYNGAEGSYTITAAEPMPTVGEVTITTSVGDTTKSYDGAGFNLTASADVMPEGVDTTYQWYGPDGEAIEGETSSTYTTSGNVSASGTYKCVVTATNSTGSADAEGAIEITIEKADQTIVFTEESLNKTVGDDPFDNPLSDESKIDTAGGATITYASDNTDVATVDAETGEVTIVGAGDANITATVSATDNYNSAEAGYTVKVAEAEPEPVRPTVSDVTITTSVGDTTKAYDGAGFNLTARADVTPDDAEITYEWYKVDGDGTETLLDGNGSAFTTGGNVADSGTYKCVVTVTNDGLTATGSAEIEITIEKADQTIVFESESLEKTVGDPSFTNPLTDESVIDTAGGATITYVSDNTDVATVDENTGEVTIVGAGDANITATVSATDNYNGSEAGYTVAIAEAAPTVDKTALEAAIAEAGDLDEDAYTPASWEALESALAAAESVDAEPNASQQEVDDALAALETAMSELVEAADKDDLEAAIEEANNLDEDAYTPASWEALESALAAAESVDADPNASQDEVDAAAQALQDAIDNLVEKASEADKEVLNDTIEAAEGLNKDNYTEDSWADLEAALAAAQEVSVDPDASQDEVKQATIDLIAAIANLKGSETPSETTDKSELLDAYGQDSNLNESDYTTDSWNALQAALEKARNVLLDPDATQDQVNAALQELDAAKDNLVKKDSGTVKNGLCKITAGELWGYYVNDEVDTSYTGFANNDYGDWYVVNGYVRFDQNTVAKDATGKNGDKGVGAAGTWWYVVGSKVQHGFTGLANYKNQNGWWYIDQGKVDFSHNGVDKNKNGWWYVKGGKVQFGFTGLSHYKNQNGWWYINAGKVNFKHNGVDKNQNGWWYVLGGKVQFGFTGLANYKNQNGWWYINAGKVTFDYTGIASNQNGTWYIKDSKVQFDYSGTVSYNGSTYTVRGGKVS